MDLEKLAADPFERDSMMIELVGGHSQGSRITVPWPPKWQKIAVPIYPVAPLALPPRPTTEPPPPPDEYQLERVLFVTEDGYVVRWVYRLVV